MYFDEFVVKELSTKERSSLITGVAKGMDHKITHNKQSDVIL